jgi:hypothetical protein
MGACITKDTAEGEVWLSPRPIRAKFKSDRIDSISHKSGG